MLFFVFSVALAGFFMFQWKRDGDIFGKNIVVMNCSFMQYSTEKDIVYWAIIITRKLEQCRIKNFILRSRRNIFRVLECEITKIVFCCVI